MEGLPDLTASILEGAAEFVLVFRRDGRVLYLNGAARRLADLPDGPLLRPVRLGALLPA